MTRTPALQAPWPAPDGITSTWPFNPKIAKEVSASPAAPILIYGIKLAIGLSGQG